MFFVEAAYAMGAQGAAGEGGANPLMGMMPLILMFVIFYFLLIRPQQQKQKQHKELLANLKKGDRILTGGGIYGRITAIDGDVLTVEIGKEVTIEINRGFVSGLADKAKKDA
jgi:preprotein translocase subunit YajC